MSSCFSISFRGSFTSAAGTGKGTRDYLQRTLIDMCLKLPSLKSSHLAVVGADHGSLKADREMLCCDDIIRTTVGAVLAAHLSLSTATLHVFSHGAAPYSLTTTKGARQEDVVTPPLVRIKMALVVSHLSCPPTTFSVELAAYLEVVGLTLEEPI